MSLVKEHLSRRDFLQLAANYGAQALQLATFASINIMHERKKQRRNRPGQELPTLVAPPFIRDWNRLDPLKRIDQLELRRFPDDLDKDKEMVRAVAERFTQRVPSGRPPEELARKVIFLSAPEYLQLEIDEALSAGYAPTSADIEKYKTNLAKTPLSRKVFLNNDLVRSFGLTYPLYFPESAAGLSGRDLPLFMLKSVLFHEFGHAVQSDETFPIADYRIDASDGFVVLNQFYGFYFTGYKSTGPKHYLNGSGEASTELVATYAARGAGM